MADHTTESCITLHPQFRRVRILDGDTLIADTHSAIELCERGYPSRHVILKEDADMAKFSTSSTVIHCPFKGEITHYSLPDIDDVAWSYKQPVEEMQAIAGRLAFDAGKVTEQVEWRSLST